MIDDPVSLDSHRGMAAQKATGIRRVLADVENNATDLRDREAATESQILSTPAASWPEAAAKARHDAEVRTRIKAAENAVLKGTTRAIKPLRHVTFRRGR